MPLAQPLYDYSYHFIQAEVRRDDIEPIRTDEVMVTYDASSANLSAITMYNLNHITGETATVLDLSLIHIYLTLDILRKRPDGYHDLRMVMQSIALHDTVTVRTETGDGDITVRTDREDLPGGPGNIAWKAARAFYDAVGMENGCLLYTSGSGGMRLLSCLM